jgi:hypothetical protein
MAKFNANTLTKVAGFDGQILAQELVYQQKDFWNMTWTQLVSGVSTPINLAGATIDAQIIRREISNLTDTRTGLSFDIADYPGSPTPIILTVTNVVDAAGTLTLIVDDSLWSILADDPELNINADNPVCFSGRIKVSFPAVGIQPAYDEQIFLLFLIVSDGVVN